ncbi:uncharacterized protein LOC135471055 [Liolophura sinensis]|uniref:uncharacterized protein LOC135471055 n=1 Tax=Liolophura sinensis TaxID=3198878 RepID=UPI003157F66B
MAHVDRKKILQKHSDELNEAVKVLMTELGEMPVSDMNNLPDVLKRAGACSFSFQQKLDAIKEDVQHQENSDEAQMKRLPQKQQGGEDKDLTHQLKAQLLRNVEIQNSKLKAELALREKLSDLKTLTQQSQSLNEDWTVSHRNSMRILKKLEEKCAHGDKRNAELQEELTKSQQLVKKYKSLCETSQKPAAAPAELSHHSLLELDELRPKTASRAMLTSFRVNDVVRRNECLTEENADLIREVQRLKRDNADLLKKAKRSMSDRETILVKLQTSESSKQELYKRLNREKQKHQSLNRSMTRQASEWIQTKKLLHQIEEGYRWDQVGPISPFGIDQTYAVQSVTKNSYMPRTVCVVEPCD